MSGCSWEPVMLFDTDDPEFVRGYEAGEIDTKVGRDRGGEFTIHATNGEMCRRIAERHVLRLTLKEMDYGFLHAIFSDDVEAELFGGDETQAQG